MQETSKGSGAIQMPSSSRLCQAGLMPEVKMKRKGMEMAAENPVRLPLPAQWSLSSAVKNSSSAKEFCWL